MNRLFRVLCYLDFHKWEQVGWTGPLFPSPVRRCTRCRRGSYFMMPVGAEIVFTPEELDEWMAKSHNKPA